MSERAISLDSDLREFPDRDTIWVSEKEKDRKPADVWDIPPEIETLLFTEGFVKKAGKKRYAGGKTSVPSEGEYADAYSFQYSCDGELDLYRDVIPLTALEIRWLKTALQDQRAQNFLSESEIGELRHILGEESPDTAPFLMSKVRYYDRYRFPEELIQRESEFIDIFLEGIREEKSIRIRYRTNAGRIRSGEYMPVTVEFSKRNNRFQIYGISRSTQRIAAFNLSSILSAQKTERLYDRVWAERELEKYRKDEERMVLTESVLSG